MRLKPWHCLALLSLLVLVVYFPSVHADYNSVDDLKMISRIEAAGPLDLLHHFFPQNKRYYYRPLTILSYYVDRDLWGSIASFMHLVNILLHLGSTLLVYAVTRLLAKLYELDGEAAPMVAALLFAIHPLTTESVCWISGRTDLLAGFFLLVTLWLVVAGLQASRPLAIVLSGVTLLLACLSKEVAVFILPGLLWMVAFFPAAGLTWLHRLRRRWLAVVIPIGAITLYFVMRQLAVARDTGLRTAVRGATAGDYDLLDKVRIALKVFGFYFKKVFIPWPLNFAIVEVSDWYVLAGVILAVVLIWFALRRDLTASFGLMAFCLLSPAILIPFGKMAWTPVAERYLYIPMAFLVPSLAVWFVRWRSRMPLASRRWGNAAMAALLLVFFVTTLHRAWIWQDNLRLYTDTTTQSPGYAPAKTELAAALQKKGRWAEAEVLLKELQTENVSSDYVVDDFKLALELFARGELEEARSILLPRLDPRHKKYYELIQALLRINDQRISKAQSPESRLEIQRESLAWLEEQQRLQPKAFTLYRMGKLQLAMGEKEAARLSLHSAVDRAPEDAYYRGPALRMIEKLEQP